MTAGGQLKVCIFNSNFPPNKGGIATFGGGLARALCSLPQVAKVTVIAFNNQRPRHELTGKLEVLAYPKMSFLRMALLVFWQVWRRRDHEIFHATTLFPVGGLVWLPAKLLFRKKVFVTVYGTDVLTSEGSAKTKWAKRMILRHCTKVLAFSRSTALKASKLNRVPQSRFAVVYPGIDSQAASRTWKNIRPEHNLRPEDFVVLTVCRLVKRKGVDDLIAAIGKISDPTVKLLIAGSGEEEESLRRLAAERGLTSRVIFAGLIPHERIGDYYHSSDVFALASKYLADRGDIEGLGIVFLEAQQFGLPVIGTASGGIPEAIAKDRSGFVVAEGDVAALAEKILLLKKHGELRRQMGAAGQAFVRTAFSWEESLRQHLAQYLS